MPYSCTKEQALDIHAQLNRDHGLENYFIKLDLVTVEGGWGVDLRIRRDKWEAVGSPRGTIINPNNVVICYLVHG